MALRARSVMVNKKDGMEEEDDEDDDVVMQDLLLLYYFLLMDVGRGAAAALRPTVRRTVSIVHTQTESNCVV